MVWLALKLGISSVRLWAYIAIITAVVSGALVLRQHYINVGWYKHVNAMAAKNEGAMQNVREAERNRKNCVDSGRTWDTVDGVCQ